MAAGRGALRRSSARASASSTSTRSPGFKAGALNFALRQTAPDAEVVAVIDSDYVVEPAWLRDLVPAFADPRSAIVQAPQDYRDAGENAFKAMCLRRVPRLLPHRHGHAQRAQRDHPARHHDPGPARVLDSVGGWAEWCITEDAELGLRLFEAGYEALYMPATYGRGLMPDTFTDFKKQRFRWAYGAMQILRRTSARCSARRGRPR